MIRHVGHNYSFLKKERSFERQRTLIVKQVLPPPCGYELGQDYRQSIILVVSLDTIDVAQKWTRQSAIGRCENN
jgi:hypothetical protein